MLEPDGWTALESPPASEPPDDALAEAGDPSDPLEERDLCEDLRALNADHRLWAHSSPMRAQALDPVAILMLSALLARSLGSLRKRWLPRRPRV